MVAATILNYKLSPSPATIFGCLLPAPWMGVVAGLLLAFGPSQGLPDRFAPLTLVLTHCLVLGMLAPIMIGALFQLMPVVAGQTVAAARYISPFVALGSALIVLALMIGFLSGDKRGFVWAAGLASLLYGAVALALGVTARRILVVDAATRTLRWIPLGLAAVVILGVMLAGGFSGWWQIDMVRYLNLHVAWGLIGWIATLLIGVASITVPMFWQTVRPSLRWHMVLPGIVWLPLLCMCLPVLWGTALLCCCIAIIILSMFAVRAIWGAKRRFDPAWLLWLISAFCVLSAALLAIIQVCLVRWMRHPILQNIPWCIGVLALVGGAVLPINAMLGKIIPFLVFTHLRRQIPMGRRVPTMQAVLPPQFLRWQSRLVIFALFLLLILPFAPHTLNLMAGISFALSQAYLGILLMTSLLRYRRELKFIFH